MLHDLAAGKQESSGPGPRMGEAQTLPLLCIDAEPLNGTARVHLVNCLLIALQDFYPSRLSIDSRSKVQTKSSWRDGGPEQVAAAQTKGGEDVPATAIPKSQMLPAQKRLKSGVHCGLASRNSCVLPERGLPLSIQPSQFHRALHEAVDSTLLLIAKEWEQSASD